MFYALHGCGPDQNNKVPFPARFGKHIIPIWGPILLTWFNFYPSMDK